MTEMKDLVIAIPNNRIVFDKKENKKTLKSNISDALTNPHIKGAFIDAALDQSNIDYEDAAKGKADPHPQITKQKVMYKDRTGKTHTAVNHFEYYSAGQIKDMLAKAGDLSDLSDSSFGRGNILNPDKFYVNLGKQKGLTFRLRAPLIKNSAGRTIINTNKIKEPVPRKTEQLIAPDGNPVAEPTAIERHYENAGAAYEYACQQHYNKQAAQSMRESLADKADPENPQKIAISTKYETSEKDNGATTVKYTGLPKYPAKKMLYDLNREKYKEFPTFFIKTRQTPQGTNIAATFKDGYCASTFKEFEQGMIDAANKVSENYTEGTKEASKIEKLHQNKKAKLPKAGKNIQTFADYEEQFDPDFRKHIAAWQKSQSKNKGLEL